MYLYTNVYLINEIKDVRECFEDPRIIGRAERDINRLMAKDWPIFIGVVTLK